MLHQPSEAGSLHLLAAQLGDQLVDLVDEGVEALAELVKVDLAVLREDNTKEPRRRPAVNA